MKSLDKVNKKDWKGLENTFERRGHQIGCALDRKLKAVEEFGTTLEQSVRTRDIEKLVSKENTQKAVVALGTGLAALGVGTTVVDGLDGVEVEPNLDSSSINGFLGSESIPIDNGVFVGNDDELANLIEAGQQEGTTHIESDEIVRDISVRNEFLQAHGYTSVPEGYEVHHVVPLSEGGSDTPSNMVLVTEEQHEKITAAHADFYGWK